MWFLFPALGVGREVQVLGTSDEAWWMEASRLYDDEYEDGDEDDMIAWSCKS